MTPINLSSLSIGTPSIAPTEVPTTRSAVTQACDSSRNIPTWTAPKLLPRKDESRLLCDIGHHAPRLVLGWQLGR